MDFSEKFNSLYIGSSSYIETDISLNEQLQETRHALQESTSENDQLAELINLLYSESRIENVATSEILSQIKDPLFQNIPLPRNADGLSLSEKAGYVVYCMKFLGYTTRKTVEEYHTVKDHLEGIHRSIKLHTTKISIPRSGGIKLPELDGVKELKRNPKSKSPPSPPITPPEQDKPLQKTGGKHGK